MSDPSTFGRLLVFIGAAVMVMGFLLLILGTGPGFLGRLGRLPGDIRIEGDNYSIYIPITTMVLVSLILSLAMRVISRFF
ncbi:DUF2905 domain-containing protein [Halarsenatibacter silvermanii]|uniref:DUF2905 domain-containing protein n=1 Tax=Halarsenatibacter silvermanii TaxID=321763 RepID=A0A1G9GZ27_9FIRM|nr:DUF2905 domain-containing protein [Halarsenatibacter silvermanii]SDL05917.1 Protein of unknown function [Halarsenatibacter silvermanii]